MPTAGRVATSWRQRGTGLALAAWLIAGCSHNPPLSLSETAAGLPASAQISPPFFAQTQYQCGPAALAGILTDDGVNITPDALVPLIYLPKRKGSLQSEILAATRRLGRMAYVLPPQPRQLLAQVAANIPVLVLQNLGTPSFPRWHYAVVVGYDLAAQDIVLNSGVNEQLRVSARKFFRTWEWAQRWAMVAVTPGELPAQPNVDLFVRTVSEFEASATPEDVSLAWRSAATRWPQDPRPYLALGNLAYGTGNKPGAVAHYREGLRHDHRSPALINNLASVLGELGCAIYATSLVESLAQTLEPDSPWRDVMRETLNELAAQDGPDGAACTDPGLKISDGV